MSAPEAITRFSGDYRFLSNFYAVPVVYEDVVYPSVEHAYQAAKTTDPDQREMVQDAVTPGRAKQLGRMVRLREGWEGMKQTVMLELLQQKFGVVREEGRAESQHTKLLKSLLLLTGDKELIEGNNWGDRYWGAVFKPKPGHPTWYEGHNHLGKLLMQVRAELRG